MDARRFPPLGQLIDVGGRRLHLLSKGSGPTVVIEQGAGGPSLAWFGIQEHIGAFARVCLYDRAGYQWSDAVAGPRSLEDRVKDLDALLTKAGVPGPYILVAHSYGGFLIRLFAKLYAHRVAGLVFVDTPHESSYFRPEVLSFYGKVRWFLKGMSLLSRFGIPRLLSRFQKPDPNVSPLVREQLAAAMTCREYFETASDDTASLERAASWLTGLEGLGSLGDLPIAVISHGQPFPGPFAVLEKDWREGQLRLAALSANSSFQVAEKANHMVHIDTPEIVIEAVRDVIARARLRLGIQDGLVQADSTLIE
jgi:pimeloyl-ACP methyl ester carboxylesterase